MLDFLNQLKQGFMNVSTNIGHSVSLLLLLFYLPYETGSVFCFGSFYYLFLNGIVQFYLIILYSVQKSIFYFLYYFLNQFFLAVRVRDLNFSPCVFVGLWYLLGLLYFFIFNIFVLLFPNEYTFRAYDDFLEACILISELFCF